MNAARLNRCSIVALLAVLVTACGTDVPSPGEIERESTEPAVIEFDTSSMSLGTRQDNVDPDPFVVRISNAGGGQLTDLQASVQYANTTVPRWLEVEVDTNADPVELRIQVRIAGLPVGSHEARVRVTSSSANEPGEVRFVLQMDPPRNDFSFSAAPSVQDTLIEVGDPIRLNTFELANSWPLATSVIMRAYRSADETLDAGDALVLESSHDVGANAPVSLSGLEVATDGALPGQEFLILVLDPDDEVMEADETNNTAIVRYILTEPPLTVGVVLNVDVDGRGTVSRDPERASYPLGSWVSLTAQPADGWVFEAWTWDGGRSEDNPVSIQMNGRFDMTATFREEVPSPSLSGRVSSTGRADLTWNFDWPCVRLGRTCLTSSSDRYELQMRDVRAGGRFQTVFESENTRTAPYTHSRRLATGSWAFRVRAIGPDFTSPWSDELTLTYAAPTSNPPAAPTNVQATATAASGAVDYQVTWVDNASNESGYHVYASFDPSTFTSPARLNANATAFTFSTSATTRTVYFRVDAWNDDGVGQSSVVSVDPPSTSGTVRFMNNTSYPVHSLVVNGTQLLPQDDDAYLPGQWYEIELETGVYTFEMVNGFWDGSFWSSLYTWSGSVLVPPGVDRDVVFPDPTASDLMTRFSSAHTWSGTYVDGTGNIRVVAVTFRDNGQWNLSIDDQANSAGTYSIESRSPAAFNVGIRMTNNTVGTLWESLGFFSVAIEPGRIAQLFPDS